MGGRGKLAGAPADRAASPGDVPLSMPFSSWTCSANARPAISPFSPAIFKRVPAGDGFGPADLRGPSRLLPGRLGGAR